MIEDIKTRITKFIDELKRIKDIFDIPGNNQIKDSNHNEKAQSDYFKVRKKIPSYLIEISENEIAERVNNYLRNSALIRNYGIVIPQYIGACKFLISELEVILEDINDGYYKLKNSSVQNTNLKIVNYIDQEIINDLKVLLPNIKSKFDLTRLTKMCEELNSNYQNENYNSCILLLRAICHHIPAFFGQINLDSLINQHAWQGSEKKIIQKILTAKHIADLANHEQISKHSPSATQIDCSFKHELAVILKGLIRHGKSI